MRVWTPERFDSNSSKENQLLLVDRYQVLETTFGREEI
jgi:hypothetical protein